MDDSAVKMGASTLDGLLSYALLGDPSLIPLSPVEALIPTALPLCDSFRQFITHRLYRSHGHG